MRSVEISVILETVIWIQKVDPGKDQRERESLLLGQSSKQHAAKANKSEHVAASRAKSKNRQGSSSTHRNTNMARETHDMAIVLLWTTCQGLLSFIQTD